MSLAEQLDADLRGFKPRNFKDWLEVAPAEDAEAALAYIKSGTIPANTLAQALNRRGVPCTRETIIKMRAGQ